MFKNFFLRSTGVCRAVLTFSRMSCRVQVQIWWLWFTAQTLHQFEREIYSLFDVSTATWSARIRFSIINMIRYVVHTVGYYREVRQYDLDTEWVSRDCGGVEGSLFVSESALYVIYFSQSIVLCCLCDTHSRERLLFHFRRHFSTINHIGWWGEWMKMKGRVSAK